MELKARLHNAYRDFSTNKVVVSLEVDYEPKLDDIYGKELRVEIKQWRERRSKDANALMWACLQEIAYALQTDKWSVYLEMLKRYGKHSYVLVREDAVERVKQQWRETEVVGEVDVNGQKAVQLLCYYGSSLLDTAEMSHLLDGIISEMSDMGLPLPPTGEIKRSLEEWEKVSSANRNRVSSAEVK